MNSEQAASEPLYEPMELDEPPTQAPVLERQKAGYYTQPPATFDYIPNGVAAAPAFSYKSDVIAR